MPTNPDDEKDMSVVKGEDWLTKRLSNEPENVSEQLTAMAGLSNDARRMHRFDEYLLAGSSIITRLTALLAERTDALRKVQSWVQAGAAHRDETPCGICGEIGSIVRATLTDDPL